jgi:hypothetical protein
MTIDDVMSIAMFVRYLHLFQIYKYGVECTIIRFLLCLCSGIAVSENRQSSFIAHFPRTDCRLATIPVESSGSRPLTEDKQARARSVG